MGAALGFCLALALLLGAGWMAIAVELASLRPWPTPDLLGCVVALWALRRPGGAPAAAVFGLGLLRDLLAGGPVGLGAVALLLTAEALRARAPALRRRGFGLEWIAACAACAAALAIQQTALTLTLASAPPLGDLALRLAASAAIYPAVAVALGWATRLGPAARAADGAPVFERRPA